MSTIHEVLLHRSTSSVGEIAEKKKTQWLTAFTQEAIFFKVQERAISLGKQLGEVIDISKITIPEHNSSFVGWDKGKVSQVGTELPLYTTELGPCIAILARAFQETDQVSHTAVHHVFMAPDKFSDTLKNLVEKTVKGTIEIFISGGNSDSREDCNKIISIIKQFQQRYLDIQFIIAENLFGLCELGVPYKVNSSGYYPESCGLKYTGFNDEHLPCQVIDVSKNRDCEADKVIWLKG